MEGGTVKAVDGDQEKVAVATSDFTADEEKPWEISILKGSLLNVLESKKKWWKVRVNGRTGYVPAECVKLLKPAVSSASQPVQSGSKRHLETDHQTEPQPLNFIDANTLDNGRTFGDQRTEHLHDNRQGPDVQLMEEIPRRRSSRLAGKQKASPFKKSKLEQNKYQSLDLTWKAATERAQQNNSALSNVFHTIIDGGRTPCGPRDIIKAPGLNKISVFPDITVKIEKVEPEEEPANHPSSPAINHPSASPLGKTHLELETRVVKEEIDLEDFPRGQCATDCQEEPEQIAYKFISESSTSTVESMQSNTLETPIRTPTFGVSKEEGVQESLPNEQCIVCSPAESETSEVELVVSPCQEPALSGSLASPRRNAILHQLQLLTRLSNLTIYNIKTSPKNLNEIDSPVASSSIVTVAETVPTTRDNSSNPCCVLFAETPKFNQR